VQASLVVGDYFDLWTGAAGSELGIKLGLELRQKVEFIVILVVNDSQIVYSDLARSDSGCKKEKKMLENFLIFRKTTYNL
jgi:hypothetical protein